MNVKRFIDRPVLSIVISVFIVLLGIISLITLPVEQYPDIAPPTIGVMASYPGASADAIQKSVIAPLEESINGVEDMIYMTSNCSNSGMAQIFVYFKQGADADMAQVNVQNRVSQAAGLLPAEVTRIGVTTYKRQPSTVRAFTLYSPNGTYGEDFISNYININIKPELQRISGVGNVVVFGGNYSMRVWLNPSKMAQYGLVPTDIIGVLSEQNIEAAVGSLGENFDQTFQYTMKYRGRRVTEQEFSDIVISTLPTGEELKLGDVATMSLGLDNYNYTSIVKGSPGIAAMIFQTAGSNSTQINLDIDRLFSRLNKDLPNDLVLESLENTNEFLFASIKNVIVSLLIAIVLVVVVVYFFLQDFRATMVPTIGIIVSLIGTFAFIKVAGFSLNLLTLFALVLVIGTVVDNSIVVVEAVQARFDAGYKSAYKASVDAMGGLTAALFTTTLVFMAVFIPVSFMGGTTGVFYKQFGLTMAVAVGISFVSALTLSPALCAIMLKPNPGENEGSKIAVRVRRAYNTSYKALMKKYTGAAMFFIRRKWLVAISIVTAIGLLAFFLTTTKTGLVPDEDLGVILVDVTTPVGSSVKQTAHIMKQIDSCVNSIPEVQIRNNVTGEGIISGTGNNMGMLIIKLKDWSNRKRDVHAIMDEIYARTAVVKSAKVFVLVPGMIPGYGMGGGFEFHVQDKSGHGVRELYEATGAFLAALNQRPEIAAAYSSYNIDYPQYVVDVDAAKCKRAGVSPAEVLTTLGGYYGGIYASNFNRFTKVYRVMIQASPEYVHDEASLDNIFVRLHNGSMAPASQFITLQKVYDPLVLNRFNLYTSIGVNGNIADGYSSGDAIKAIKEVASQTLPRGYGIDFSGITREEEQTGSGNTAMIFLICIVFIYLVMAALYESFFIPFAVILSVPFGLMGSFLFARLFGLENNIYLQVGLIMLIGLLSKTAILLTEYATQCRRAGMSLKQSAFFAAKMRMRPILMTALTMIFGMLPLMFASGVGANGNRTIGAGAVGGELIGTLALLFIVPALFVIFQAIQEKVKPIKEFTPSDDPLIQRELELIAEYTEKKKALQSAVTSQPDGGVQ
ncbi:MAG: efflux RND transporter permease subunit [Bacteroidales bacterium]|nr:efflux RND transporter permease subunit [Bacteroidales bacterium]